MNPYEIIKKKRDGGRLTPEEIAFFVRGYTEDLIPDYQMSALLMAIYFRGMSFSETKELTLAMMKSGDVLDLSSIPGIKVDKHSTGGVGDKVSLLLAPLVASCGVPVPMVSGRGLGHTGGTLDKLESIPGFRTKLSTDEFIAQIKRIGVAIMGQTKKMAPADGKIYALRDVTGTVDSIPLITASILSKKFAEGTGALVLDVKTGSGAFMCRKSDAILLAKTMVKIGKGMGRAMVALITNMDQPLGRAVGNSLEVEETILSLKGGGPEDLQELTLTLGAQMLILAQRSKSLQEGRRILEERIKSGEALAKFRSLVEEQGGDSRIIDNPNLLPQAKYTLTVSSLKSGYVQRINCLEIGLAGVDLGAGRRKIDDLIEPGVGILIEKKVGDLVKKGEPLALVRTNDLEKGKRVEARIREAYILGPKKKKAPPLIFKVIGERRR